MGLLGASGAIVGTVAGLGEFLGYGMRLISGKITDKTKIYWPITFMGYASNLIVVPLLALAHRWEIAALLIILERVGKGIRTPARDAMLSYATKEIGRGWGFGIHQAMDRLGALVGPLIVFCLLGSTNNLRISFVVLGIPAVFALAALGFAKKVNPYPQAAEEQKVTFSAEGFSKAFWIFIAGAGFLAAGFVDFALIAFHFQKKAVLPPAWIPLFYTFAMGAAALFSLAGGKLFDFFSKPVVLTALVLGMLSVPCVFMGGFSTVLIGMILWGIGLGMQGSVLRSIVAHLAAPEKRSVAYGTFGVVFGLCWFIGSALTGWLYDHSIALMVAISLFLQLCSIPFFLNLKMEKSS
ncbi:MAG: MFS transporter [Verrucomicrobia bacterium]|nr:MFS transporter [Verrucomicrobiota bacterium]